MQIPWGLAELEQNYSLTGTTSIAANLPRAKWDAADKVWRLHYTKHNPKLLPGARRVLANLPAVTHLAWSPAVTATASTASS